MNIADEVEKLQRLHQAGALSDEEFAQAKGKLLNTLPTPQPLPNPSAGRDFSAGTRLMRSSTDRMLAGVCGGIAKNSGMDPTLVRVAYALITFFTAIIPGVIVYIILAIIIPSDATA